MSSEATVNPDGSTTFNAAEDAANAGGDAGADDLGENMGDASEEMVKGTDPALYLALAVVAFAIIFVFVRLRKKRSRADVDDFFSNLDGDKVCDAR